MSTQPNSTAKGRNDPYRCNISVGNRWFRDVPLQRRRMSTCCRLLQLISHHPKAKFDNILRCCKQAKLIFSEFGIPNFFISDNARQYDSAEFRKFEDGYDFKHETSSPRYPQMQWKIGAICRHRDKEPTEGLRSERGSSHRSTVSSHNAH